MRRVCGGLLPFCVCLCLLVGCKGEGLTRFTATYVDTFDTVVQLVAYDTDAESFRQKSERVHEQLKRYDRLYDIYTPSAGENTLYTVNAEAGKTAVEVDEAILDLLAFGQEMHRLTDGRVNVAAGAVLSLWHKARTHGIQHPEEAKLPDKTALADAAAHIDIEDMVLDHDQKTVFLSDPQMRLDVGAIAKGYATERVARMAATLWKHAALSAGGNVCVIGDRADGNPWNIGIERPDGDADDPYVATVSLTDRSLVTSGDYQRYYTVDGKIYHHLIDLQTGMPAAYFRSTTVLCVDSGLADGLSTALFVMPLEEGKRLIESIDGAEALWVLADGSTVLTEGMTEMRSDQ